MKQSSIITIGLVFAMLFGMAFACGDDRTGDTDVQDKTNNQTLPFGRYAFMSITTFRADGSPNVNTNLTGGLTLSADGRYEHDLWMGKTPFGCGPGTYRITDNKLYLKADPNKGCKGLDYTFAYDAQQNRLSLSNDDKSVIQLLCKDGENNCFK